MKSLIASLAVVMMSAPMTLAQTAPVVVELYTSQGCSSCPPADALMQKLVQNEDVIGLSLHVDYWDYIGWKDKFADPAHTSRQQGYARVGGRSMIYTPQMIVNGQEDVVGARAMELMELINAHRARAPKVTTFATRNGSQVEVSIAPIAEPLSKTYSVQMVQYAPLERTEIKRGELAGHNLDYVNVVENWQQIGIWDGQGPLQLSAVTQSDLPAVVLVQESGLGAIIGAVRVK